MPTVREVWEAMPEDERLTAETLENYYQALDRAADEKSEQAAVRSAKAALFCLLFDKKIAVPCGEALVKDLCGGIALRSPTSEDAAFLEKAGRFLPDVLGKPITGKLNLLLLGMALEKIAAEKTHAEQVKRLTELPFSQKANMTGLTATTLRGYLGWLLPSVCAICLRPEECERVFSLFEWSPTGERVFLTEYLGVCCTHATAEKDCHGLCMYFGFACRHATKESALEMGALLRERLGKAMLKELDQAVQTVYHNDPIVMSGWAGVSEAAGLNAPRKLGSVFGFFRHEK